MKKKEKYNKYGNYEEEEDIENIKLEYNHIKYEANYIKLFKKNKIIILIIIIIIFNIYKLKDSSRIKALLKSRKYLNICLKGLLINNININETKIIIKPKITVIIPIYNSENIIKPVIRSIQNQNMLEIEIILVNDFSKDNTSKIIKELAKKDNRIKIINNIRNMGTLYSRCIGTLEAKGKYILPLDNDDLFMDYDLFSIVFEEAEKDNYDIIGFNAIRSPNYKFHISEMIDDIYHDNPNNLVLYQPELALHSIVKNGKYEANNIHIWGKCIKTYLYKNAVNALGKKRYSLFISWAEDTSMVFILFNLAKSYKFISKYGIIHLMSELTACYTESDDNKMLGELLHLDIMLDFSINDFKTKKYIFLKCLEIRKLYFFENTINNIRNRKYLNKILNKIYKCKYIKEKDKLIINNNYYLFNSDLVQYYK